MKRMRNAVIASIVLALGLAACGHGAPVITDGSGQPVQIGTPEGGASTGPGSPGWPEPSTAQRAH